MGKGYVHVYTGNGKGKTTAAFGLALRALCAGRNVAIGQFVKSMKYNETKAETLFDGSNTSFGRLRIELFGRGCFIDKSPEDIDIQMAHEGLGRCVEWLTSGDWDVVILDEITIAVYFKLLTAEEILSALEKRNKSVEVIITGRYAPQQLIDYADLVTDMQEIKHYYAQGILSRYGIDH